MPDAVTAVNGLRKSYDGLEAVRSIGFAVGAGFGRVTILRDGQGNLFEEGTLIDEINIVTGPSLTVMHNMANCLLKRALHSHSQFSSPSF
jgi:hypothetical protein